MRSHLAASASASASATQCLQWTVQREMRRKCVHISPGGVAESGGSGKKDDGGAAGAVGCAACCLFAGALVALLVGADEVEGRGRGSPGSDRSRMPALDRRGRRGASVAAVPPSPSPPPASSSVARSASSSTPGLRLTRTSTPACRNRPPTSSLGCKSDEVRCASVALASAQTRTASTDLSGSNEEPANNGASNVTSSLAVNVSAAEVGMTTPDDICLAGSNRGTSHRSSLTVSTSTWCTLRGLLSSSGRTSTPCLPVTSSNETSDRSRSRPALRILPRACTRSATLSTR
mmetsp:Transcript_7617/g.24381  ORF Transcript_7617/g.24381 Transcript_7617/m.24381 type:complete len:290 (+) Transcript_7617:498-1367(+)